MSVTTMLNTFIKLFTEAEIANYKSKLLHSTSWSQHGCKAYGEDKLQAIPLNWLKMAGQCELVSSSEISQGKYSVINLGLKPKLASKAVNYTLWVENNGKVIKSIHAIVDTKQLADITKVSEQAIAAQLPTPDALVIQHYDQQDHLQEDLAKPSNITELGDKQELLDTWWSIWANAQLAAINSCYAKDAQVSLPGLGAVSTDNLFNTVLSKYSQLTRVFCQLELVVVEGEQVALKWYLDGDESGERIRLPFITMLTIKGGKIVSDLTTSDTVAFKKRFSQSKLMD